MWNIARQTVGLLVADQGIDIGGAVATVKVPKGNGLLTGLNSYGGYHAVSGSKQLACGTVKEWTLFKLGRYERDLHPHVELNGSFTSLLDEPPFGSRPDETCEGCLWGEVTVPEDFTWVWQQHAPKKLDATTPDGSYKCGPATGAPSGPEWGYCAGHTEFMTGGQFCMYGPWVMEGSHGDRAEIHPVQAFWGQSDGHAKVYFTKDASRRFEREEDFSLQFLSRRFKSWGSLNGVRLYQVVRIPSDAGGAHLVWEDHPPTARVRTRSETNTDLVAVRSPQWAIPRQVGEPCRATDGTVQVLMAADIAITDSGWRGLNVSGTSGVSYSRPRQQEPSSSTANRRESAWRLATAVEWNRAGTAAPMVRRETAKAWGVLEDETKWMAVPAQNYRLDLQRLDTPTTSAPPPRWPDGLRTHWTISVFDLDRNAPATSGVLLTLGYPRGLRPNVIGANVILKDISPVRPFALVIRFNEGSLGAVHTRVPNLRVSVKVRADAPGLELTDSAEFLAMAPDFVSKVSGYDLEARQAAFPEVLVPVLSEILVKKEGCLEATLRRDLAGVTEADDPLPAMSPMIRPRLRRAGILRQAVHKSLHDKTMDFGEFRALLRAFWGYRQVCKARP